MFGVTRAFDKLKKIREMFWSGRPDLNRRPPAPKAGDLNYHIFAEDLI
jgi:hypothetical protein